MERVYSLDKIHILSKGNESLIFRFKYFWWEFGPDGSTREKVRGSSKTQRFKICLYAILNISTKSCFDHLSIFVKKNNYEIFPCCTHSVVL